MKRQRGEFAAEHFFVDLLCDEQVAGFVGAHAVGEAFRHVARERIEVDGFDARFPRRHQLQLPHRDVDRVRIAGGQGINVGGSKYVNARRVFKGFIQGDELFELALEIGPRIAERVADAVGGAHHEQHNLRREQRAAVKRLAPLPFFDALGDHAVLPAEILHIVAVAQQRLQMGGVTVLAAHRDHVTDAGDPHRFFRRRRGGVCPGRCHSREPMPEKAQHQQ